MLEVLHMAVTTSLRMHVHTCTHAQRKSLTVGSSCSSMSLTLDVRGDTDEQQPYPQFEPCQQKLEGHGMKDLREVNCWNHQSSMWRTITSWDRQLRRLFTTLLHILVSCLGFVMLVLDSPCLDWSLWEMKNNRCFNQLNWQKEYFIVLKMWHHLNYNMYSTMIPAVGLLPVLPALVFICLCVYRSKGRRVLTRCSHQLLWEDNWDSSMSWVSFPWITPSGRPLQMAKPTHLAPTSEEEEQFYSVLLQDVWTHDPVSKAEPHHPGWTSAGFVIYKKNPLKFWRWEETHIRGTPICLLLFYHHHLLSFLWMVHRFIPFHVLVQHLSHTHTSSVQPVSTKIPAFSKWIKHNLELLFCFPTILPDSWSLSCLNRQTVEGTEFGSRQGEIETLW